MLYEQLAFPGVFLPFSLLSFFRSFCLFQDRCDRGISLLVCQLQGRQAVFVLCAQVGSGLQQSDDYRRRFAIPRGLMQRRLCVFSSCVRVPPPPPPQRGYNPWSCTPPRGMVQGRPSVLVPCVNLGPGLYQGRYDARCFAPPRRSVQRGLSIFVSRVRVGSSRQAVGDFHYAGVSKEPVCVPLLT